MKRVRRLLWGIFTALLVLFLQSLAPMRTGIAAPDSQAVTAGARAQALLDTLAPEEKIGQLFLVQFEGSATGAETDIYNLIINRHIGGVILRADHDNISGDDPAAGTLELIQNLQQIEWLSTQQVFTDTLTGDPFSPVYIPLFVGISQPGDGAPYDQIITSLTQLPSPMAIGATWDPSLAEQAGVIAGRELSMLGINLLLGPSLDVLENPNPESGGDLGVRTFGGDPFWVGQMGSAYIRGIHKGSVGRMVVIGKHFPGVGGSDRPIEEEVSTVRKSLEQLKQIELAPFFYVTGEAPSPQAAVDGLLISHIRYQGFFGNIRATTRPVSFDEASFSELMTLEPFAAWRDAGGVMISDDLGSTAVRRFYDPSGLSFNARLVVRDAFLAGNDMLYLGDILDTGDEASTITVLRILDFFTQKYREDVAFAQHVDAAVLRILTLKFKTYQTFGLNEVIPNPEDLADLDANQQTVFDIARAGATLISPDFNDLETLLPDAPGLDDRLVFLTDTNPYRQCSECPPEESLERLGLEQTISQLYGPDAGNQIQRRNLFSHTFEELAQLLDGVSTSGLENDMRNAGWIVIAMQDVSENRPSSLAIRRLLAERDDLIRGKRVIVFAFNAPYFLDATDISKLTAYYALYSKTPETVEIAARILFKEFAPTQGNSPVSVAGIGYDLISATSPDPEQLIRIFLRSPEMDEGTEPAQEPPAPLEIPLGKLLVLETGVILDHNGHAVPDGTPVQFIFRLNGIDTLSPIGITFEGIARMSYSIAEPGVLQIGLLTEPAAGVIELEITIPTPEDFGTPDPVTATPEEPPTSEPVLPATESAPEPVEPPQEEPRIRTDIVDWLLTLLVSLTVGWMAYRAGSSAGLSRWRVRWGLSAAIGGLLVYLYLAMGLRGSLQVVQIGHSAVIWTILAGALLGWGVSASWYALHLRRSPPHKTDPPRFRN